VSAAKVIANSIFIIAFGAEAAIPPFLPILPVPPILPARPF
jgi:hypothetical protein